MALVVRDMPKDVEGLSLMNGVGGPPREEEGEERPSDDAAAPNCGRRELRLSRPAGSEGRLVKLRAANVPLLRAAIRATVRENSSSSESLPLQPNLSAASSDSALDWRFLRVVRRRDDEGMT